MRKSSALPSDQIRRILLINFGGIGDELLFFPTIETLREYYPEAKITALVEPRCEDIMRRNYLIDKVLTVDIKGKIGFSELVDLVGMLRSDYPDLVISSGRSPLVPLLLFLTGARYRVGFSPNSLGFLFTGTAELNPKQYAAGMLHDLLKGIEITATTPIPKFWISPQAEEWALTWLESASYQGDRHIIMLHPGTSHLSRVKKLHKHWSPSRWGELVERLTHDGYQIMLAGGPDDAEAIHAIRAATKTPLLIAADQTRTIEQLAALIKLSRLLVCVDSAPMHLGVAVGTPLVALFGPTDEAKLLPADPRFTAVRLPELNCSPCLFEQRQTVCEARTCMEDLSVESVYQAITSHLSTLFPAQLVEQGASS